VANQNAFLFELLVQVLAQSGGGTGTSGTGGGTSGTFDMQGQAGWLSIVGTVGTTISFNPAWSATYAGGEGDYVIWTWGADASDDTIQRGIDVVARNGSAASFSPSIGSTQIWWIAIGRTQ